MTDISTAAGFTWVSGAITVILEQSLLTLLQITPHIFSTHPYTITITVTMLYMMMNYFIDEEVIYFSYKLYKESLQKLMSTNYTKLHLCLDNILPGTHLNVGI